MYFVNSLLIQVTSSPYEESPCRIIRKINARKVRKYELRSAA